MTEVGGIAHILIQEGLGNSSMLFWFDICSTDDFPGDVVPIALGCAMALVTTNAAFEKGKRWV